MTDRPTESRVREPLAAMPGDVYRIQILGSTPRWVWAMRCPLCRRSGTLDEHTVTVEGDIPTVTPSLVCPGQDCAAHYWVRAGVIEWC